MAGIVLLLTSKVIENHVSVLSTGKLARSDVNRHTVVLLTDDRNLRVKAHAANIPVKDLSSFMKLLAGT